MCDILVMNKQETPLRIHIAPFTGIDGVHAPFLLYVYKRKRAANVLSGRGSPHHLKKNGA